MDFHHCGDMWCYWHSRNILLRSGSDRSVIFADSSDKRYLIKLCKGVDLADEDRKFMQYLADNGWRGDVGEDEEVIDDDTSSEFNSVQKK